MATVDGRTVLSIDELIESTVIGGYINDSGQLVLTTRGGAHLPAGDLTQPFGAPWLSTITYLVGDAVGYAGMIWRCLEDNTNKPPALFSSKWVRLAGESMSDWAEKDPYFDGDSLTESWNVLTTSGTSAPSLTSTAGQFESGIQALKLTMGLTSFQRIFVKEENIVRGGETVRVQVRAKLVSAAAGVTLAAELLQNDSVAEPIPGATGLSTVSATQGAQTLTTTWTTYTFTMTAANAKPRANANVMVTTTAANATVVIDYIRIIRGQDPFLDSHPVGAVFMTNSPTNPGTLYGGTWTAWGSGRVPVGVDAGQTEFDTVEETGGAKTHTLTSAEMPGHTHTGPSHSHSIDHNHDPFNTSGTDGAHVHSSQTAAGTGGSALSQPRSNGTTLTTSAGTVQTTNSEHAHAIDVPAFSGSSGTAGTGNTGSTGGGGAHNNLQPYITCYMWKRTA